MILFPHHSLFIHIPRTSGMSLTALVMRQSHVEDSGVAIVSGDNCGQLHRHARATELRYLLPGWHGLQKFAVIRNPWRTVESTYRYWHRKRRDIEDGLSHHPIGSPLHQISVERSSLEFSAFVQFEFTYLTGGFWRHWCCDPDGGDLGVQPVMFERLDEESTWSRVCGWLQLPATTQRTALNGGQTIDCPWTADAVAFIQSRCEDDLGRFGYPRQP